MADDICGTTPTVSTVFGEFSDLDEFPHAPGGEPGWSESYLVQAYSPSTGVGIFAHTNRCHFDPSLWSEVFAIYLPGDRFVVAKGFGYGTAASEVGGSLSLGVEQPFGRVTTGYRGAGQPISGPVLRAGGAPSGQHVGVELALVHDALGPAFAVGDVRPGAFGHTHYEQHMRARGQLICDGERIEFDGTGLRDHTWGPRDLSVMGNHVWLHGEFPSGRWFTVTYVCQGQGGAPLLEFHAVGDRDGLTRAELVSPAPLLTDEEQVRDGYQLSLRAAGTRHTIRGDILAPMAFSFAGPVEMTLGSDRTDGSSHTIFECQTRYEWDGEIGYGLSERSVLH